MKKRRAGWSLVETTVSMLVGTVALVALAGALMSTSYVQSLSTSRLELTSLCETKLDQLRSHAALQTSDTTKVAIGGSLTSDVAQHYEQVTTGRGRKYSVRWQVVAGLNGTRDVTVRVAPAYARRNETEFIDMRTLMLVR